MQLHFKAVSELGLPGKKWQKLYHTHWRAYEKWLDSKPNDQAPDLKTSQAALKKYMPKMWPIYKHFCKLAKADDVTARFLTGFQPPAYVSGCSNAVLLGKQIQLVRNYDYHPSLTEGTQLLSAWHGKKVIATSDCLIGALDGMNEDGLAISLTFGGRKIIGKGFGAPFILRYVLEFCSHVEEAVATLVSIPFHMSYNVTVVDKTGTFKTLHLAPDRKPLITDAAFTTNHQGTVDWHENAVFNKTLERAAFLEKMLTKKDINASKIVDSFLQKPLFNTRFHEGFGTLFTAVYKPSLGEVELRWPGKKVTQTFKRFQEQYKLIDYSPPVKSSAKILNPQRIRSEKTLARLVATEKSDSFKIQWQENSIQSIGQPMIKTKPVADDEQRDRSEDKSYRQKQLLWKLIMGLWIKTKKGYWTT